MFLTGITTSVQLLNTLKVFSKFMDFALHFKKELVKDHENNVLLELFKEFPFKKISSFEYEDSALKPVIAGTTYYSPLDENYEEVELIESTIKDDVDYALLTISEEKFFLGLDSPHGDIYFPIITHAVSVFEQALLMLATQVIRESPSDFIGNDDPVKALKNITRNGVIDQCITLINDGMGQFVDESKLSDLKYVVLLRNTITHSGLRKYDKKSGLSDHSMDSAIFSEKWEVKSFVDHIGNHRIEIKSGTAEKVIGFLHHMMTHLDDKITEIYPNLLGPNCFQEHFDFHVQNGLVGLGSSAFCRKL